MNFFGHAAVGAWYSRTPAFLIGTMAPDWTAILGRGPLHATDPGVLEGFAFHHRTDHVFHSTLGFRTLQRQAYRALTDAGIQRPSALATAHVGIELLIDAVMARDSAAVQDYISSLNWARGPAAKHAFRWPDDSAAQAFQNLIHGLAERASRLHITSVDGVSERLIRILAARPRLALGTDQAPLVALGLGATLAQVEAATPALLAEMRHALGRPGE